MNPNKRNAFIRRWEEIQTEKAKLGLKESKLLAEIRGEFPDGHGGDLQFKEWCLEHLGPVNTPLLLKKAKAPQVLGESFARCRDWKAATALMNFRTSERHKIVKAISATRPTAPLTRSTIATTGYKLGFRSCDRRGQPMQMELHKKVDLLCRWILKLYADYDLPTIPDDVRRALGTNPIVKATEELKEILAESA